MLRFELKRTLQVWGTVSPSRLRKAPNCSRSKLGCAKMASRHCKPGSSPTATLVAGDGFSERIRSRGYDLRKRERSVEENARGCRSTMRKILSTGESSKKLDNVRRAASFERHVVRESSPSAGNCLSRGRIAPMSTSRGDPTSRTTREEGMIVKALSPYEDLIFTLAERAAGKSVGKRSLKLPAA